MNVSTKQPKKFYAIMLELEIILVLDNLSLFKLYTNCVSVICCSLCRVLPKLKQICLKGQYGHHVSVFI
jgi:hypothetical protein